MANFLRMLLGLCLLPLCWAAGRSFVDAVSAVGTGEGYVALPNVRISAAKDAGRMAELLLTERNIL